jgi:phosphate transport system permease protein
MSTVAPQVPITPADRPTRGDRIFRSLCVSAAFTSLVIVGATIVFMVRESRPAFRASGIVGFFKDSVWNPSAGRFGVLGVLLGTIIIATLAIVVAVPLALAMALFVNEYAPKPVARWLTTVIDLLAALPSLMFGMFGLYAFQGHLVPVERWLTRHLFAIPIFQLSDKSVTLTRSSFIAGVVVGIMVMPIVCSVSREVMSRAPRDVCEGALALGGTKWGMIRSVILPFGRSGIVGGILLGFGRALGETIAVALLIQLTFDVNWHVLEAGGGSIAALIAIRFGESTPLERSGLVAAGLALLVLTFGVTLASRRIVSRKLVK